MITMKLFWIWMTLLVYKYKKKRFQCECKVKLVHMYADGIRNVKSIYMQHEILMWLNKMNLNL